MIEERKISKYRREYAPLNCRKLNEENNTTMDPYKQVVLQCMKPNIEGLSGDFMLCI